MTHKMHHVQNRGKEKSKLSKTRKLNENRGKFINFEENIIVVKFINYVQIRGQNYSICITGGDLGGLGAGTVPPQKMEVGRRPMHPFPPIF